MSAHEQTCEHCSGKDGGYDDDDSSAIGHGLFFKIFRTAEAEIHFSIKQFGVVEKIYFTNSPFNLISSVSESFAAY